MRFEQFYSSSSANLYMVTASSGRRLMLECGATWAQINKALKYDISNIAGCLLTHEHQDHCKAVREVMQAGINVYASEGTIEALGLIGQRRAITLAKSLKYSLDQGNFSVMAFSAHHDAAEPLIFVIKCDDEYLLFAPDTSHITQRFNWPFSVIALECSYDRDILSKRVAANDINEALATRLLNSHMEKQIAFLYLSKFCDLRKCREIHLLHMSKGNIDREQTVKEFEGRFFIKTITL